MAYRLARSDHSVTSAVRRIACEQVDAAMRGIDDPATASDDVIHDVRKHCKKVRALLRLVRPVFDGYAVENVAFRDIARAISNVRDADVLLATYDDLVGRYEAQIERRALAPIRRGLTLRRNALASRDGNAPAERLAACRASMVEAAGRVQDWTLQADGFAAMQDGLRRSYRRARKAMRCARMSAAEDDVHTWRKHCKDHWYHARLLQRIWRGPMQAHVDCMHRLGDLLGEHHDLAVFTEVITGVDKGFGRRAGVEVMAGLVATRQDALAAHAFRIGARVFAESPSALVSAWGIRYDVWRGESAPDE